MKKLYVATVAFILFLNFSLELFSDIGNSSFIVNPTSKQKKIKSKNRLKEELGCAMKSTIDECAFMMASVGDILAITGRSANCMICKKGVGLSTTKKVLHELANVNESVGEPLKELGTIQQQLSAKVEGLINNRHPFKHAGPIILQRALDIINDLVTRLKNKGQALMQLKLRLGDNSKRVYDQKVAQKVIPEVEQNFQQQLSDIGSLRLKLCQNDCLK